MRIAPGATSHSGGKLAASSRVFALPPPEIGDVLSVGSTVEEGGKPVTLALRAFRTSLLVGVSGLVAGAVSLIPAAILVWLLTDIFSAPRALAMMIAQVLVGLACVVAMFLAAPIAWKVNGPHAICLYVGREGLAQFSWGDSMPKRVLRFEDARTLTRKTKTEPARGERKARTYFDLQWFGRRGVVPIFRIRGFMEGEIPAEASSESQEWFFAIAAERAWNTFLLGRARQTIASKGHFEIVRDDRDASRRARIGVGFLEIVVGDLVERWNAGEVDTIEVDGGTLTLRRIDPLRGRGTIVRTYPGGPMDNESFFRVALREIAALPVEDRVAG